MLLQLVLFFLRKARQRKNKDTRMARRVNCNEVFMVENKLHKMAMVLYQFIVQILVDLTA